MNNKWFAYYLCGTTTKRIYSLESPNLRCEQKIANFSRLVILCLSTAKQEYSLFQEKIIRGKEWIILIDLSFNWSFFLGPSVEEGGSSFETAPSNGPSCIVLPGEGWVIYLRLERDGSTVICPKWTDSPLPSFVNRITHTSENITFLDLQCYLMSQKKLNAIDISRIRTAVKLTQSTWTLVSNHKPKHAVRPKLALVTPE